MVPPMHNRVRGKNRQQRQRAVQKEKKISAKITGKKLHGTFALKTAAGGKQVFKSAGSKKLKKKEQRARLLGKVATAVDATMSDV